MGGRSSIQHLRVDVGTMDGGVAACAPAGTALNQIRMIELADHHPSRCVLQLGVTFQTEVHIAFHEHFVIDGTMRRVTGRAALPHGFMLKNKRASLILVAIGATFVQPGHRQPARRLVNIRAMRIMTLNAVHPVLRHRMMLRKVEGGMNIEMTLKTGGGILAWVVNEFAAPAAPRDML